MERRNEFEIRSSEFGRDQSRENVTAEPVTNRERFEENTEPIKPAIGREEIRKAREILNKYQSDRAEIDTRIAENQSWWRLRDWTVIKKGKNEKYKPHPTGGQLFSSIINKHADAMDNFPQPDVLPREAGDEASAKTLSSVLPCILERCGYRKTYSTVWNDKLVAGTGITAVFWDKDKDNVGDIAILPIDPLMFYSDPHIADIQKSRNVFTIERRSREELCEEYPQLMNKQIGESFTPRSYNEVDSMDDNDPDTVNVIDWYYKRGGLLHYVKFVGDEILFASENEPDNYPNGFYAHGLYPFDVDVCYEVKNSPYGFGEVDIGRPTQENIDRLDQAIIKTAISNSKQRYFVRSDGGVNEEEFADTNIELVHVASSTTGEDSIRPISKSELNPTYLSVKQQMESELREATSNREFSQGGTAAGVTSGSAIAALQEAGNKTSRDMIGMSYFSFERICYLVIELIREFYTAQRSFRITGEGASAPRYATISSEMIGGTQQNVLGVDFGEHVPVYDIRVVAQKSSAFSREIQNQRAQELYGMGFFAPQNADTALACLAMMDFEGKDKLEGLVRQNGTMYQQMQMLMQEMERMRAALGMGDAAPGGMPGGAPPADSATPDGVHGGEMPTGENAVEKANTSAADAMRARVQNGASPL